MSDGYARNFLLPKNLVKPATRAATEELESQKAKLEKQIEEFQAELEDIGKATAVEPLAFRIKVGERGEVFGSVGAPEIREKLIAKYPKLATDKLVIEADHIKELGRREVSVKLGRGLEEKITIEVLPITTTEL